MLTEQIISRQESSRFLSAVQRLSDLPASELRQLNVSLPDGELSRGLSGIF
jgi:hypothetical protein